VSPSGRFTLEVLRASPRTAGEDWRFRVVDVRTGAVVLEPGRPGMDGGLGLVVAWGPGSPDTVWATRPNVRRWRPAPERAGRWDAAPPAEGEPVPPVVDAARRGDGHG
jgi:hypothetical protein